MFQLEGKVALITGGSRGIGRAIIMALAEPGLTVVFNHFDPPEDTDADETIAMAQDKGCEIEGMRLDVADYKAVQEFFAGVVDRHGRGDILGNNAGITRDTLLMRMDEEMWDLVIKVNLKSVFNFTKAVQKYMLKARTGSIINMSSVVGVNGNAGQANYSASKAGLDGLTRALAREVGRRGITVNSVTAITRDETAPQSRAFCMVASRSSPGWPRST